jgi:hypothetical protein
VRKVNAPTALAGTDTPRIPTEYHNMLAYEAAARFLEREADDSGRVEALRTQFQVMLEAMRMAVFGTHTSFSMGIRGRYQRRRAR